ncbi:hypothetical protein HCBG_04727 [Histoplasma capsulatum G186AR]|uniref:Uncharacterized protein n=1 Tax=Ajellomyces capsulatus (strain G186AR / H82 / ATCC MYA-2454 / RMSCC 2432) TaxID=447093 RepID=C0NNJ7_AJECG|nr:uncharacterized protein HCBG_04727 [Histoplasma capsulatum G186AR]EEH06507.1 hypothetical protein HCBG_04727 [Histoplasma capsulatum G186AR]
MKGVLLMRGRGTSQQHGMRNPGQRLHASHFKGVEFNTVGILKIVMIMVECSSYEEEGDTTGARRVALLIWRIVFHATFLGGPADSAATTRGQNQEQGQKKMYLGAQDMPSTAITVFRECWQWLRKAGEGILSKEEKKRETVILGLDDGSHTQARRLSHSNSLRMARVIDICLRDTKYPS